MADMGNIASVLGASGRFGFAQDRREHGEHQDRPPLLGRQRADRRHPGCHRLDGRAGDKHALGMSGRKGPAAQRRARLIQYRRALRRRLGQVDRVHRMVRAGMVDGANPLWPGEHPRRPVAHHGVVRPASLPQSIDRRHVVVGDVVAVVVGSLRWPAIGPRGAVEIARHDVPSDPSARQVVKRGHAACEGEWRLVGQVDRDTKAKVLGHRRHGRYDQGWVVGRDLHCPAQCRVRIAGIDVVHPEHIGEEHAVEQPGFQHPRQIRPVSQAGVFASPVARMGP